MFGKPLVGKDTLGVQSNTLREVHVRKVEVDLLLLLMNDEGTCNYVAYMNYVITNEFIHFVIPTELQN